MVDVWVVVSDGRLVRNHKKLAPTTKISGGSCPLAITITKAVNGTGGALEETLDHPRVDMECFCFCRRCST